MPTLSQVQDLYLPVSIADLPTHDFSVTPDALVEEIVLELEKNPKLPGVMIVDKDQFVGMITRLKLFERLAHRFGVELFLQKPVVMLRDLIRTGSTVLPPHLPINDAVQYALSRDPLDVYDPVVFLDDDGKTKLIDINLLLMTQSMAMASLSNVFVNLEQIDQMIVAERNREEVFAKLLQVLRQVIPYHQAAILMAGSKGFDFLAFAGYRHAPPALNNIQGSAVYILMVNHRQPIYLPKAHQVPAWEGLEALGNPASWLGVPLFSENRVLGLLSISRNVDRAFTTDERDTALAFGQRILDQIRQEELIARRTQAKTFSPSKIELSTPGTYSNVLQLEAYTPGAL